MSEQSPRLRYGTPSDTVILALNGALERLDAIEERMPQFLSMSGEPITGKKVATDDEPLTQADVRQAVEHAVRETRSGTPDATAPWTLHLGPGCVAENTETGNRFAVEAGNAIPLDADVKLAVLDKAEEMIDPRAKPKPEPIDAHMVRAVLVENVETNAMGRAVWTIDLQRAGHGERPFRPGDLVIRTPGFQGFFEIVDIELEHHSSSRIGLVVKPAPDLAFDVQPE